MRLLSKIISLSIKHNVYIIPFCLWFSLFTFFQKIDPYLSTSKCSFPTVEHDEVNNVSKVLIIADPQLIDNHTYPSYSWPILKLSQFTVDNYISRNYISLLNNLKPDMVIFLGDLLDNGRESEDAYYEEQFNRFHRIFVRPILNRELSLITNVPGNHDIGWAEGVTKHSLDRFIKHFGEPNKLIDKYQSELVLLDVLSLSNKDNEEINSSSRKFLDGISGSYDPNISRILFDHVTVFRDAHNQKCGGLRESKKPFPVNRGYQYQTVLDQEISNEILNKVRPEIVFSGDDHDYCEVVNTYTDYEGNERKTVSINVKSISMAMGIWDPAVELLTLYEKPIKLNKDWIVDGETIKKKGELNNFQYDICYLTKPYRDIAVYVIFAVLNGFWILCNCFQNKKTYVSLIEKVVYEQGFSSFIKRFNYMKIIQMVSIQALLTMGLYYLFTIH